MNYSSKLFSLEIIKPLVIIFFFLKFGKMILEWGINSKDKGPTDETRKAAWSRKVMTEPGNVNH